MPEDRITLQNGEVLFREGDESDSAFTVLTGEVELTKDAPDGPVQLAVLGKGETFGEMGVLDGRPRSATARALGPLTVQRVSQDVFLQKLEGDPQFNRRVIDDLVHRLRAADGLLAQRGGTSKAPVLSPVPAAAPPKPPRRQLGTNGGGLLRWLFGPSRRSNKPTSAPQPMTGDKPLVVLVPPVENDTDNTVRDSWVEALAAMPGITPKPAPAPGSADEPYARKLLKLRQTLAEEGADLLIWGLCEPGGERVRLRVVNALPSERPGQVRVEMLTLLPAEPDPAWQAVVQLAALCGLEPRSDIRLDRYRATLASRIEEVRPLLELRGMTGLEQAGVMAMVASGAATLGFYEGSGEWLRKAGLAYRKALDLLPRDADQEWGALNRALGLTLQALADQTDDADALEEAIDAFHGATEVFTRELSPRDWSQLQNRLGIAYYRLDLRTGDPHLLKRSLNHYQSALQEVPRETDPARWAEIMNNLCQTLQVYGDHMGSVDILNRAVETARAALEERPRETAPLSWATSQNNLGSAYFLMARLSHDPTHLEAAVEAFGQALEVFEAQGVARMRTVTRTNLDRANAALRRRSGRNVGRTPWEEEAEDRRATVDTGSTSMTPPES